MRPPRSLMFYTITKFYRDNNKLFKFLDFSLYLYSNFVYFRVILGDKLFSREMYFSFALNVGKQICTQKKPGDSMARQLCHVSHAFHFVFYGDAHM